MPEYWVCLDIGLTRQAELTMLLAYEDALDACMSYYCLINLGEISLP
ncbi:hypothetical protein [Pectobacterium cacticida]